MEDVEQLRRTNKQLHSEVADLTSALLARDLELVRLRERCHFLTTAVEQQDEVIASMHTTTLTPSKGNNSNSSKQTKTRTTSAGFVKKTSEVTGAKSELKRYEKGRVSYEVDEDVVKINLDQLPYTPRVSRTDSATASVYSLSSTATASSSSSLFGDGGEVASKTPLSWNSPSSYPIVSRRPSLERQDSSPTDERFASSAGFLRKSNRTMSRRLSVEDLGLFHNEDEDNSNNNPTMEVTPLSTRKQSEESYENGKDNLDARSTLMGTTRSRSQRNLFDGVDEFTQDKVKQKRVDIDPADCSRSGDDSLTYGEFLQRISLPASRDILDKIRMFVVSILGPRGDGKPPRSTDYAEYVFYGNHELCRRCNRFFVSMGEMLQKHPAWRHASEAMLTKARDGVEKYVMDKVSDIAFNQRKECQQWMIEDKKLLERMQLLSFITPAMLDIKPCMRNEVVWSMAEDELRRINSFCSPGDKINCVVRCCSVIFSVLNLSRGESGSRPGADDFLPVFIYIVLHSRIPRLYSNCEYISAYRNQDDLISKAGYCFVNLRSAIEFIMVMDGSMLSISDGEFQSLYTEREKLLLKS